MAVATQGHLKQQRSGQDNSNNQDAALIPSSSSIPSLDKLSSLISSGELCPFCRKKKSRSGCYAFFYFSYSMALDLCAIPYGMGVGVGKRGSGSKFEAHSLLTSPPNCSFCQTPRGEYHHLFCAEAICPNCKNKSGSGLCRCDWNEYRAQVYMGRELQDFHILVAVDPGSGRVQVKPQISPVSKGNLIKRRW